jgi:glycine cleavage system H lipoate-binding protein
MEIVRLGVNPMAERVMESKKSCIWADAGVVQFKLCDSDYDCQSCEFDRAMTESATQHLARRRISEGPRAQRVRTVPWEDKMRQRFGERRRCQFMQSNLCHQCSFDELLEEQFDFFLAPEKPRVHEVFGIQVPTSSFLHRGHTWVALESAGRVRLGLDDFSQKVLGQATKFILPKIGQRIKTNEPFMTLGRQRKKAKVLAPLEGVIEAVNPKVREKPEVTHDDPYGEGWLFIVTPSNLKEDLETMLFGHCNIAWIKSETHRLLGMLEAKIGATLPSGGNVIDDVFGNYPKLGWNRLVREFLHTY